MGNNSYSLTVSQGGSEGSAKNPVELTLGTAHSGTIDNIVGTWETGYSYYKFTTASADNYTDHDEFRFFGLYSLF